MGVLVRVKGWFKNTTALNDVITMSEFENLEKEIKSFVFWPKLNATT